jgi:hypothetical protein
MQACDWTRSDGHEVDADAFAGAYDDRPGRILLSASRRGVMPELARLRGEAVEAAKRRSAVPTADRCEAYIRFSMAWAEIATYALDHRESCGISQGSLDDLQKRYREAVQERSEICAGRQGHHFPPEIWR